ncbi:hypothetical protein HYV81_00385 [Candidatus Woesearchaeota archaeon]|nr:hypothetical protein [Candidatus Woesearchaeota archaeon]
MKDKNMPVFIKIEEYKDIREIIELLKLKIEQAKKTLEKVNQLKQQEDAELSSWQSGLAEIEKKLGEIDDNLYEPEGF